MKISNILNSACKRTYDVVLSGPPNKKTRMSNSGGEQLTNTSSLPSSNDSMPSPHRYHLLSINRGLDGHHSSRSLLTSTPLNLDENRYFSKADKMEDTSSLFLFDLNDQDAWEDADLSGSHTPLFDEPSPLDSLRTPPDSTAPDRCCTPPPVHNGPLPPPVGCCTPPPVSVIPYSPKTKRSFRQGTEEICENIQNATKINNYLRANPFLPFSIDIGQQEVMITGCLRELSIGDARGAFSDVFLVEINSVALAGITTCVLKIPNERYRQTNNSIVQSMLNSELFQYDLMKSEFDCIALHYDFELLKKQDLYELQYSSHGCHLVEYVPDAYPVSCEETQLSAPQSLQFQADLQLQTIFQKAYEKNRPLDLSFNNTRLINGQVKCIDPWDPLVVPKEYKSEPFSFHKLISTFAPKDSQRAHFLDPSKKYDSH